MNTENISLIWRRVQLFVVPYAKAWNPKLHDELVEAANSGAWEEVGRIAQDIWAHLPDSPAIRQPGFGSLCELAEEYCFGDSDEEREEDAAADI